MAVSAGCQHGAPVANPAAASSDLNSPAYWIGRADAENVAGPTSRRSELADMRASIYARLGDAPHFHAALAERDRLDLSLTSPTDYREYWIGWHRWDLAACFALLGDRGEFIRAVQSARASSLLATEQVTGDLSELGLFADMAAIAATDPNPDMQVVGYCRLATAAAKAKDWAVYEKAITLAESATATAGWNEGDFEQLAGSEVDAGDLVRAGKSIEKCDDEYRVKCYADIAQARFRAGDRPGYEEWIDRAMRLTAAQHPEFEPGRVDPSIGRTLARAGDEDRLDRASFGPLFHGFDIGSNTAANLEVEYWSERAIMSAEVGDAASAQEVLKKMAESDFITDHLSKRDRFAGLAQPVMLALAKAGKDTAVLEMAAHLPAVFETTDADAY